MKTLLSRLATTLILSSAVGTLAMADQPMIKIESASTQDATSRELVLRSIAEAQDITVLVKSDASAATPQALVVYAGTPTDLQNDANPWAMEVFSESLVVLSNSILSMGQFGGRTQNEVLEVGAGFGGGFGHGVYDVGPVMRASVQGAITPLPIGPIKNLYIFGKVFGEQGFGLLTTLFNRFGHNYGLGWRFSRDAGKFNFIEIGAETSRGFNTYMTHFKEDPTAETIPYLSWGESF